MWLLCQGPHSRCIAMVFVMKHLTCLPCAMISLLLAMMVDIPIRGRKRPRAEPVAPVPEGFSPLGTGLLIRWGEGQLSAADVQDLAKLAAQSGATDPEVICFIKHWGIWECFAKLQQGFEKALPQRLWNTRATHGQGSTLQQE